MLLLADAIVAQGSDARFEGTQRVFLEAAAST
jgi:hypothetical protein